MEERRRLICGRFLSHTGLRSGSDPDWANAANLVGRIWGFLEVVWIRSWADGFVWCRCSRKFARVPKRRGARRWWTDRVAAVSVVVAPIQSGGGDSNRNRSRSRPSLSLLLPSFPPSVSVCLSLCVFPCASPRRSVWRRDTNGSQRSRLTGRDTRLPGSSSSGVPLDKRGRLRVQESPTVKASEESEKRSKCQRSESGRCIQKTLAWKRRGQTRPGHAHAKRNTKYKTVSTATTEQGMEMSTIFVAAARTEQMEPHDRKKVWKVSDQSTDPDGFFPLLGWTQVTAKAKEQVSYHVRQADRSVRTRSETTSQPCHHWSDALGDLGMVGHSST